MHRQEPLYMTEGATNSCFNCCRMLPLYVCQVEATLRRWKHVGVLAPQFHTTPLALVAHTPLVGREFTISASTYMCDNIGLSIVYVDNNNMVNDRSWIHPIVKVKGVAVVCLLGLIALFYWILFRLPSIINMADKDL